MNLDEALAKDKDLKEKLLAAIAAKTQLDVMIIGKSDRCPLGNWLHGEAERKYPFIKSFKPTLEAHAAFHVQAGKVVKLINGGEYADAEALLGEGSAYSKSLTLLEGHVKLLKRDAKL